MTLPTGHFKEPSNQSLPPYRQVISEAGVPIMELNSTPMSEMDGRQSLHNRV
jgi:hypothetical protein